MSTAKVTKPKRLTEDDAGNLEIFEDWQDAITFYLSQEKSFTEFLEPNAHWSNKDVPNRGLVDLTDDKKLVLKSAV